MKDKNLPSLKQMKIDLKDMKTIVKKGTILLDEIAIDYSDENVKPSDKLALHQSFADVYEQVEKSIGHALAIDQTMLVEYGYKSKLKKDKIAKIKLSVCLCSDPFNILGHAQKSCEQ